MKKTIYLISFLCFISCSNHKKEKELILRNDKLTYENLDLKKENDSLRKLIADNFLFNNVGYKIIPSKETPEYNNEEFKGKVLIFGYNEDDRILMDKNNNNDTLGDTIMNKSGMYNFSVNPNNTREISLIIDLEFKGSRTYDSITRIPYEGLWLNK